MITETTPVYKTEPVIDTSVIKLTFGAKEIFTTITETHGVTTRTDYITATKTVNGGGLGGVTAALGGLSQLGQQSPEQARGNNLPTICKFLSCVSTFLNTKRNIL